MPLEPALRRQPFLGRPLVETSEPQEVHVGGREVGHGPGEFAPATAPVGDQQPVDEAEELVIPVLCAPRWQPSDERPDAVGEGAGSVEKNDPLETRVRERPGEGRPDIRCRLGAEMDLGANEVSEDDRRAVLGREHRRDRRNGLEPVPKVEIPDGLIGDVEAEVEVGERVGGPGRQLPEGKEAEDLRRCDGMLADPLEEDLLPQDRRWRSCRRTLVLHRRVSSRNAPRSVAAARARMNTGISSIGTRRVIVAGPVYSSPVQASTHRSWGR